MKRFSHAIVCKRNVVADWNLSARMYPNDPDYNDFNDGSEYTDDDSLSINKKCLTPEERGQAAILQARAEQREQWLAQLQAKY